MRSSEAQEHQTVGQILISKLNPEIAPCLPRWLDMSHTRTMYTTVQGRGRKTVYFSVPIYHALTEAVKTLSSQLSDLRSRHIYAKIEN